MSLGYNAKCHSTTRYCGSVSTKKSHTTRHCWMSWILYLSYIELKASKCFALFLSLSLSRAAFAIFLNWPISMIMATLTALKMCCSWNKNASSSVGDPDFWYVTLWLTWNHKSSDPFPSRYYFPSSSICFSFGETKLFTLSPSVKT